jgi:hypothetical protein
MLIEGQHDSIYDRQEPFEAARDTFERRLELIEKA